jgi:hypothetical protein
MTDTGKVIHNSIKAEQAPPGSTGELGSSSRSRFRFAAGDVTRSGGPAVVCYFVRRLPEGVVR